MSIFTHIKTTSGQSLRHAARIMFAAAALIVVMQSCGRPDRMPATFFTLKDAVWQYGDTLVVNPGADTLPDGTTALLLAVRHTNEYPYANLWLEVSYRTDGDTVVADTFNILLADSYGKWLGKGSGPVMMLADTLSLRHTPSAATPFGIRHVMRTDALPQIEQIGIEPLPVKS